MRRRNTHTISIEKQERKQANKKFNEVRKFAYVLGARGREILLVQQSITRVFKKYSEGYNS